MAWARNCKIAMRHSCNPETRLGDLSWLSYFTHCTNYIVFSAPSVVVLTVMAKIMSKRLYRNRKQCSSVFWFRLRSRVRIGILIFCSPFFGTKNGLIRRQKQLKHRKNSGGRVGGLDFRGVDRSSS